jgi:hypothetical protein
MRSIFVFGALAGALSLVGCGGGGSTAAPASSSPAQRYGALHVVAPFWGSRALADDIQLLTISLIKVSDSAVFREIVLDKTTTEYIATDIPVGVIRIVGEAKDAAGLVIGRVDSGEITIVEGQQTESTIELVPVTGGVNLTIAISDYSEPTVPDGGEPVATLTWQGMEWAVHVAPASRDSWATISTGPIPVGDERFFVDDQARLHLRLKPTDTFVELVSHKEFGPGIYRFHNDTRLDMLPASVALSLGLQTTSGKLFAVEFGVATGEHNSRFLAGDQVLPFTTSLNGEFTTQQVEARPNQVRMMALHDHVVGYQPNYLISAGTFDQTTPLTEPAKARIAFRGQVPGGEPLYCEAILSSFQVEP